LQQKGNLNKFKSKVKHHFQNKHRGTLPIVQFLVEAGVDPNLAANDGTTPAAGAARFGHVEVVRYLMSIGVKTA